MSDQKEKSKNFSHRILRLRWIGFPAFIIVLAVLIASPQLRNFKFFYSIEQAGITLRLLIRGEEDPAKDAAPIVIVTVDDQSLQPQLSKEDLKKNPEVEILEQSWPWDRSIYGFVANRLIEAGAKVVTFDFVFLSPAEGDDGFLNAIEEHPGKIVIGYDYSPIESPMGTYIAERLPAESLLPEDETDLIGFVNVHKDPDGALRRAKLWTNIYKEKQAFISDEEDFEKMGKLATKADSYPSLAAQTAIQASGENAINFEAVPELPVINYGGYDYFEKISFIDIVLDDRWNRVKSKFKDAIVYVGPYSDFFKDVLPTPLGDMFGVETHAHVTRSLINNSFYQTLSQQWRYAFIGMLALLLCFGFLRLKAASSKGIFLILILLAYGFLSQIAFTKFGLIFPLVPTVWLIVLGGGFLLLVDYVLEQYERKRLRSYFDRYVSPEVAQLIAEEPDHLENLLRGAKRPIVTMFSDIRGFTALSEQVDPVDLVEQLNEYFEAIVEVIMQNKGSLNKYIGDAVLAVWGAIYSDGPKEDCRLAVQAAEQMLVELERLNQRWEAGGRPGLKIGIGLCFGEGFVGNLGHSQRKEFAVMGDVVNLASRLEGLTKQYGCSILISEETRNTLHDQDLTQEIDRVRVKGRSTPVSIYQPLTGDPDKARACSKHWAKTLEMYRLRQFEDARAAFERHKEDYPEQKDLAALFANRCRQLLLEPPSKDWSGVTDITQK